MIIQILPPVSNHEVTNTVTLRIERTSRARHYRVGAILQVRRVQVTPRPFGAACSAVTSQKKREKKGKRNHGAAFWPDIFQLPVNMIGGERSCKSRARRCPQHAAVINRRQPQPAPTFHGEDPQSPLTRRSVDLRSRTTPPSHAGRSTPPIETSLANRSGSSPVPSPLARSSFEDRSGD